MESITNQNKIQVIVFPYPIQGHINPMLQFSKQLASRDLQVTLVTTSSFTSKLSNLESNSITIETISDGSEETAVSDSADAYIERFDIAAAQSLTKLVEKKLASGHNVRCIVYDSSTPWALDVARKFGISGASFFTQSCLVNLIYYQVYKGILSVPIQGPEVRIADMPLIKAKELPSFVYAMGKFPAFEKLVFNQFSNYEEADWRFFNTIDVLETKVVNWMVSICPVKTIGPCIPSKYLDNRIPDDSDYGLSLFHPETDLCMQWLDAREDGSVVYISMGSLASLGKEQMDEMAKALVKSNNFFLWVVRASEESKLPLSFKEETSQKGLIVNWCPQLEVLAHPALGCFVTHCGWNSILEAISLGVPMVAIPQWTDQPTNAKCVMDFWGVGVKVKASEDGFVTKEEIEFCISKVMEGESAKEIRSNAIKYKKIAKETMGEGGSSARNIEEFVTELLST